MSLLRASGNSLSMTHEGPPRVQTTPDEAKARSDLTAGFVGTDANRSRKTQECLGATRNVHQHNQPGSFDGRGTAFVGHIGSLPHLPRLLLMKASGLSLLTMGPVLLMCINMGRKLSSRLLGRNHIFCIRLPKYINIHFSDFQ